MYVIGITGPTGAGKTTALRVLEELGGQVVDCDAVYHRLLETDGELLGRIEAAFPGVVRDWTLDRKALGARVYADPEALNRLTEITWPAVRREVEGRLRGASRSHFLNERRDEQRSSADKQCLSLRTLSKASASGGRHPSTGLEAGPPAWGCQLSQASCDNGDETPNSSPDCWALKAGEVKAGSTGFAVIDAIGLFESGLAELCDLTAAVVADEEVRVRRLMARDGISEAYARTRIAAQKPAAWFAERADLILENNGSAEDFAEKCRVEFTQRLPAS